MKIIIGIGLAVLLLQSCHSSSEKKVEPVQQPQVDSTAHEDTDTGFFPVTDYLRGQLREITEKQINPKKYVSKNGRLDSSWLKMEELPDAFSEFMHPEIDSSNLISLFTEKRFLDQTIDAFTFTYDPIAALPDSVTLQHWDVYVDPKTGKVRRIYMVKNFGETKTRQLTWQSGKWCKIVDIIHKRDGTSVVEKEVKITWDL